MSIAPPIDPKLIERPDPILMRYYFLVALMSGPAFPFTLLALYFRYITLRYKIDDSGVSMRWGILFRKEVYLTYRRIQDIHLTRNFVQRWFGLAKISLQTASGSSQAELCIEGILAAEQLRDFLYTRMRGAKGSASTSTHAMPAQDPGPANLRDEATVALLGIRDALQQLVTRQSTDDAGGR
ncbi:MAG: PH domain-containing protein [Planctomycetales bacterium]|nr:PH domain-containing protein [Planctomycetales bacterium]